MTLSQAIAAKRRLTDRVTYHSRTQLVDARLERDIERAKMQFIYAKTPTARTQWLRTFEALIAMRSPEQVARMEAQRGLR